MFSKNRRIYQLFFLLFIFQNSQQVFADQKQDYNEKLKSLAQTEQDFIPQTIESLSPSKKEVIKTLLDSLESLREYPSILTKNEWQELELDDLLNRLDRSTTSFGFWGLRYLTHPIADVQKIRDIKKRVEKLAEDAQLRNTIENIMRDIKLAEEDLTSFWDDNEELQVLAKKLFYSTWQPYTDSIDNKLNHSRFALEGITGVEAVRRIFELTKTFIGAGIFGEALNAVLYKTTFNPMRVIKGSLFRPIAFNNPFPCVYDNGYDENDNEKYAEFISTGNCGDVYQYWKGKSNSKVFSTLAVSLVLAHFNLSTFLQVRDNYRQIQDILVISNLVRNRMVQMANLFKAIQKLHDYLQDKELVFDAQCIDSLNLKNNTSKDIKELFETLDANTFSSTQSNFYWRGKVLLAHQLLHDFKNQLIPTLQKIAIIDGYLSIAKLYQERKNCTIQFCFAQFDDVAYPLLSLHEFWTPLMQTEQAVSNSIHWNEINKIILTGPNGCGKSTIMKAAAHAIILAQSWGIVPAQKAKMSVFTGLRTALSPRESLQNNLSTFMAEKARMDEIRSFISKGTQKDHYFVLLDEPYRGTIAGEAEQRICVFGQEMSDAQHCMLVLATHLEKPISLENDAKRFANYQLELDEKDGKFIRTFKLLPGAALWWFHDMDRRARFIDQLLIKP